ncbi:MAG TPA: hypothetical protein VIJ92_04595 [Ginsengibacter sp.]
MSRRLVPAALILFFLAFPFKKIVAQTFVVQSMPDSFISVKAFFKNEIKENALLYTGKEFIKYSVNIKGHPFFETDQMQTGSVFYDGTLYENVPLLYDIVAQEIIINRYNSDERIKLLNEKIKYFIFDGHRFENIFSVEGRNESISNTFYDIMFTGKASVLVKRIKHIKNGLRAEDPTLFVEEDELYVRNGNNLYAIDGKNSILQAFSDKKDLVKTFIRKNKFRFKKNIEKELILTTEYYSTLNK